MLRGLVRADPIRNEHRPLHDGLLALLVVRVPAGRRARPAYPLSVAWHQRPPSQSLPSRAAVQLPPRGAASDSSARLGDAQLPDLGVHLIKQLLERLALRFDLLLGVEGLARRRESQQFAETPHRLAIQPLDDGAVLRDGALRLPEAVVLVGAPESSLISYFSAAAAARDRRRGTRRAGGGAPSLCWWWCLRASGAHD